MEAKEFNRAVFQVVYGQSNIYVLAEMGRKSDIGFIGAHQIAFLLDAELAFEVEERLIDGTFTMTPELNPDFQNSFSPKKSTTKTLIKLGLITVEEREKIYYFKINHKKLKKFYTNYMSNATKEA